MDTKQIAQYTGLDESLVKYYLTLSPADIYNDTDYINHCATFDKQYLEKTLPLARKAYEARLNELSDDIRTRYGLNTNLMSAFTLGNWVVGILQYPAQANKLLKMHDHIPGDAIRTSMPRLLEILNDMPEGAQQWQQALCTLSFPLIKKR